jgi:hypothetical protein
MFLAIKLITLILARAPQKMLNVTAIGKFFYPKIEKTPK